MIEDIVDNVHALGIQYQLGNHRGTYKTATVLKTIFLGILALVSSFATLFFTIIFSIGLYSSIRPFDVQHFGPIAIFFMLFIVLFIPTYVAMLRLTIQTYQSRGLRVLVYDSGLLYIGRKSLQRISWQDIQKVQHSIKRYRAGKKKSARIQWSVHTYTINCPNDTLFTLYWTFENIQELGKSVEVETARYLFPADLHRCQMNADVAYGPLRVTSQGIYYKTNLLLWGDVESIDIDEQSRGYVRINKRGRWFRWAYVKLAEVPNVEVFGMLVQHVSGGSVSVKGKG